MGEARWELTVCSGPFAFHGWREKGAGVGGAVWRCDCQPENWLQRWERCSEIPHSTFSEVAACWHRCSPKREETVMVVGSVHGAASFAFSGLICPAKARVTRGLLAEHLTCFRRDAEEVRRMLGRVEGAAWRVHLKVLTLRCLGPENHAASSSSMLDTPPTPSKLLRRVQEPHQCEVGTAGTPKSVCSWVLQAAQRSDIKLEPKPRSSGYNQCPKCTRSIHCSWQTRFLLSLNNPAWLLFLTWPQMLVSSFSGQVDFTALLAMLSVLRISPAVGLRHHELGISYEKLPKRWSFQGCH